MAAGQTVSSATTTQCSSPDSAVPCPSVPIHMVSQGHQQQRHLSPLEQQQPPGKRQSSQTGADWATRQRCQGELSLQGTGTLPPPTLFPCGCSEEPAVPGLRFLTLLSLWLWERGRQWSRGSVTRGAGKLRPARPRGRRAGLGGARGARPRSVPGLPGPAGLSGLPGARPAPSPGRRHSWATRSSAT